MNASKKTAPETPALETETPLFPVAVQFRHLENSKAIYNLIQQQSTKLNKYYIPGATCTVVIDETAHRSRTGIFEIHAKVSMPGEPLYISRSPGSEITREGLYHAITQAFDCLRGQIGRAHKKNQSQRLRKAMRRAA